MSSDPGRAADAHRALEQRALANVHALAQRLGYRDSLDRRKERIVAVALGVVAFGALAAIAVIILMPDERVVNEARTRCELEVRLASTNEFKRELLKRYPYMGERDLGARLEGHMRDMKPIAEKECAGKLAKG